MANWAQGPYALGPYPCPTVNALLAISWGHLGASWGHLGPSWGYLGPSWGHLGRILGILSHLRPILAPSRAKGCPRRLGSMLLGIFDPILGTTFWPKTGIFLAIFGVNFWTSFLTIFGPLWGEF